MKYLQKIRLAAAIPAIAVIASSLCSALHADSASDKWSVPTPDMAKKNPITQNQNSVAAGEKIYQKRCVACHGKTGNADGPDAALLGITPARLSDPRLRNESDGALFWRITTGKKPMPGYGSRLSQTDRWNLVNYIRTLSKN